MKKVTLSYLIKVRSRPSIVDIFIYDIQAMLGGILPEHHALERDLSRVNYTSCPMGILISS